MFAGQLDALAGDPQARAGGGEAVVAQRGGHGDDGLVGQESGVLGVVDGHPAADRDDRVGVARQGEGAADHGLDVVGDDGLGVAGLDLRAVQRDLDGLAEQVAHALAVEQGDRVEVVAAQVLAQLVEGVRLDPQEGGDLDRGRGGHAEAPGPVGVPPPGASGEPSDPSPDCSASQSIDPTESNTKSGR